MIASSRTWGRNLVHLLLACCAAAGCSDGKARPGDGSLVDADGGAEVGSDVGAPQPVTEARSFIIAGPVTLTSILPARPTPVMGPTRHEFMLRIDPAGKFVILSDRGSAARAAVDSSDGVTFAITAPLRLNLSVPGTCAASVSYTKLTVTSGANGIAGSAEGDMSLEMGDVAYGFKSRWSFEGIADTAGPELSGELAGVDPLSGLFIRASEALPAGVTGEMTVGGETVALTPFLPIDTGVVAGFNKAKVALRYGASYQVAVTPWVDLAGNLGATPPTITTLAAPPLIAEDGFENAGTKVAGAAIAEAATFPSIAGTKSLAIYRGLPPPSLQGTDRVTVRLAVNQGDSVVRVAVRPFGLYAQPDFHEASIQVAVPGGAIADAPVTSQPLSTRFDSPVPSAWGPIWFAGVQNLEISLPAGVESEIVFDATVRPPAGCRLGPSSVGILIDDLRVE